MKELNIGDQVVRVRATPLALLFYRQEFKSDLVGDLIALEKVMDDPSQLDSVALLQLVWAMAKADAFGKEFPSFMQWVSTLDYFDMSDEKLMTDVLEEAADGFFRTGAKHEPKGKRK